MAVSSFFSRIPGLGNQASCVDLSRITLTTTSARPLGKFLYVLLFHISSFQSAQRGGFMPVPSSSFHPSQWESVPTVRTLREMQWLLGRMSGLAVPVNNSFFLANCPLGLQPKTISQALFPGGRWDTGQIPEGPALSCLPVNLETLSTHTAQLSTQSVGQMDFPFWINQVLAFPFLCLGRGDRLFTSETPTLEYRSIFLFHFPISYRCFCQMCFAVPFCRCFAFSLSQNLASLHFLPEDIMLFAESKGFVFFGRERTCVCFRNTVGLMRTGTVVSITCKWRRFTAGPK